MKATISIDGYLQIKAENELEQYALNTWCKENIDKMSNANFTAYAKPVIDEK